MGRIATFLPKSDLLTCTLINTAWETEIRKRILALSRWAITEHIIACSQNHLKVRKNCPRSIELFELDKYLTVDAFVDFISENGHKIKTLETGLTLPNPAWPRYLESLSNSFPNMTSLVLNLTLRDDAESISETQFPPETYSFSKVKELEICSYFPSDGTRPGELDALFSSIIPQFAPLFPNLVALSFADVGDSVVQNCIDLFPTLTRLKFVSMELTVPLRQNVLNLTRLEIGHYFQSRTGFSALLKIASATLEYLTFCEVPNLDPLRRPRGSEYLLLLPILPRLRVFEFVQNQCTEREMYQNSNMIPGLFLQFVGVDSTTKRWEYRVHLPVLETIRILRAEMSSCDKAEDRMTEQEYFEANVSFLYDFFLHESNSPGLSVKQLDVPFPPGDKFRLVTVTECECGREIGLCECFEFWDRVVAVFPNLVRYAAMGGAWERARAAKVKQWVDLGEELGFVREIRGEDAGRKADLNLGD